MVLPPEKQQGFTANAGGAQQHTTAGRGVAVIDTFVLRRAGMARFTGGKRIAKPLCRAVKMIETDPPFCFLREM